MDMKYRSTPLAEGNHSLKSTRREIPTHILKEIASRQIRRSSLSPEFLKQFSKDGLVPKGYDEDEGGKFKVISGSEAAKFYRKYLK